MGSSSNRASDQARQAELERQMKTAQSVAAINRAYENPKRAADIADYQTAVQSFLNTQLNRDKQGTDRDIRFAMARNGLSGGSADVDANRAAAEAYQQGILEATRRAQGAGASLRAQDQQAKNNLIALAQSGMDATTAAQQAAEGIRVNLANARADVGQQTIGNTFAKFADLYKSSQEQRGKREAQRYGMAQGLYGPIMG